MRGTFLIDTEGRIKNQVVNMGIADRRDQSVYLDWLD
jgi:alkyl hydroperoxide reductase subunit AhpC